MSRYIDRDVLRKAITEYVATPLTPMTPQDIVKVVWNAPTADVVEVRHGYWKQNPFFKSIYYCSECGRHIEDGSNTNDPTEHFPYCHCGAKMGGERREE